MANNYHTSMETNGLAPTDPWFSNSVDRTLDPELDPRRDLDFAMHQPITRAPSTPTAGSTYGLRPRISLTPHGKIQQECQSLATARRNNAQLQQEAQPDAYPETPPRTDLTALEETMGGAVSVEDLQHMIAMDPSRDLTPPSPAKNMTPELLDSRRVQLDALLDQHGFSKFGPQAEDISLFSPNPQAMTVDADEPSDEEERIAKRLFQTGPSGAAGGRPTNHARKILDQTFQNINDLVQRAAEDTKRSPESIVSLWHQGRALRRLKKSYWNKYQAYFADNAKEEKRRVRDANAGGQRFGPLYLSV